MEKELDKSNFKKLIPYETIKIRLQEIAKELNHDFKGKKPIFIGILNGSFMFLSDLFKEIEIECQVSFIKVASYSGEISTGTITELVGLSENITDRPVIVVEDIVDSGATLKHIMEALRQNSPKSIAVVTLLSKPKSHKYPMDLDYVGFEIDDKFVVGYGLDYNGSLRNSRDILVLK